MPSSIFSFDRAENGFTLSPIMAALVASICLIFSIELAWRTLGAKPGYVDSKPRWSWVRSNMTAGGGVALLGASRMQFGFSLDAFRDRYGDQEIHQLAVAGAWPHAALEDLASDETFSGIALVSFTPDIVMPFRRHDQAAYVSHFRDRWNTDIMLNFLSGSLAESTLVTRHHNYGLDSVVRKLLSTGKLPPAVLYMETTFDREIHADYSNEDVADHQARRIGEAQELYDQMYPVAFESWKKSLDDFLANAKKIHSRGGCVIAIRFPSQGELYEKEEALFPKRVFWSALEEIPYIGHVHFEELSVTNHIQLPDLQHVDRADKYKFTQELLDKVELAAASVDSPGCRLGN